MAEAQLQQFREKVRQLNAFLARCDADPMLLQRLRACEHHDEVVALARECGFEIARRWGEGLQTSPGGAGAPEVPSEPAGRDMEAPLSLLSGAGIGSCPPAGEERCEVLLQTPQLRLERIHSCSAVSPEGFWYEQQEHEWVLLLQGSARLLLEAPPEQDGRRDGPPREVCLGCGDSLRIPAGRRHRVSATDPDPGTIWLALFWRQW